MNFEGCKVNKRTWGLFFFTTLSELTSMLKIYAFLTYKVKLSVEKYHTQSIFNPNRAVSFDLNSIIDYFFQFTCAIQQFTCGFCFFTCAFRQFTCGFCSFTCAKIHDGYFIIKSFFVKLFHNYE